MNYGVSCLLRGGVLVPGCLPGWRAAPLSLFYCCVVSFALSRRLCFFLFARVASSDCCVFAAVYACFTPFCAILWWLTAVCVRLLPFFSCFVGWFFSGVFCA